MLINELSSRKCCRNRSVDQIKTDKETLNFATDIMEVFNFFFHICRTKSRQIDSGSYLQPTNTAFSLKAPTVSTVCELLSQLDEKNAVRLDIVPCTLLK